MRSENNIQRTIDILTQIYGPDAEQLSTVYATMGKIMLDRDRLDDANGMLQKALKTAEAGETGDHKHGDSRAFILYRWGMLYQRQGRLKESVELMKRSLELALQLYPPSDSFVRAMARIWLVLGLGLKRVNPSFGRSQYDPKAIG